RPLRARPAPSARRSRRKAASRKLLALRAACRECLLGGLATRCDRPQILLDALAAGTRLRCVRLGVLEHCELLAERVARELPPHLERLALESSVQLAGLGLPLERPQAAARLPLDVEGAVKVVLRARELELGPAPPL